MAEMVLHAQNQNVIKVNTSTTTTLKIQGVARYSEVEKQELIQIGYQSGYDEANFLDGIKNCAYLFSSNSRNDLVGKLKYDYTRDCTNFHGMFVNCNVLTAVIPALDTKNGRDFASMFAAAKKITTVSLLNISNATSVANMFLGCECLENVAFEGEIKMSISFFDSPLNIESCRSIITALYDYSQTAETRTLTLSATSKALLTDSDITAILQKGWSVA